MDRFNEKTVIVTGAGSGIGAAAARRFAAEGANLTLADRDKEGLAKVLAHLDPARTLAQLTDVSRPEDVQAMVDATVTRFGAIDVLVSNAGVAIKKDFAEITPEDWRNTLAVDLDGVFYCARAALPHLIRSKGSIVHTASVSGIGGDWGMTAYNAAKGGVANFTRALALDLGKHGVRVNAVCPTLTESGMSKKLLSNEALVAKFHDRIALNRHATPEEIAGPIAFLASDDASFITGVLLPVDGGLTASNGQPRMG
jgi:meso-butanediol dehydrogenase / (S,S)-butanediol dehydrogenase / diacetyl reductase